MASKSSQSKNNHNRSFSTLNLNPIPSQSPYNTILPRLRRVNLNRSSYYGSPVYKRKKPNKSTDNKHTTSLKKLEKDNTTSISFSDSSSSLLKRSLTGAKIEICRESKLLSMVEYDGHSANLTDELEKASDKLTSLNQEDFKAFLSILERIIESVDSQKHTLRILKGSLIFLFESHKVVSDQAHQEIQDLKQALKNLRDSLEKEKRSKTVLSMKLNNLSKLNIDMNKQLEELQSTNKKYKQVENRGYGQDENSKKLIDELIAMGSIIRKQKEDIDSLSVKEFKLYRLIEAIKAKGFDPEKLLQEMKTDSEESSQSKHSALIPKLKLQNIIIKEQPDEISYYSRTSEESENCENSMHSVVSEVDALNVTWT
jgi:chromosome segregation ATPase